MKISIVLIFILVLIPFTSALYWSGQSSSPASTQTLNPFNQILNTSSTVNFYSILNISNLAGNNLTATTYSYTYDGTPFPDNKANTWIDMSTNVLLYHFNETSGNVIDSSGLGNDGLKSSTGVIQGLAGLINNSARTDRGYINTSATTGLNMGTNAFTINFWMKAHSSSTSYPTIFVNQNGWTTNTFMLRHNNIGNGGYMTLYWYPSDPSLTSTIKVPFNEWHMITVVRNSTNLVLFIDGAYNNKVAFTGSTPINLAGGGTFTIGRNAWDGTGGYFNGTLDEFAIFNKSLSNSEIQTIYNEQLPTSTPITAITTQQGFDLKNQKINATGSNFTGAYWDGTCKQATTANSASTADNANYASTSGYAEYASYADYFNGGWSGTIALTDASLSYCELYIYGGAITGTTCTTI